MYIATYDSFGNPVVMIGDKIIRTVSTIEEAARLATYYNKR